MQAALRRLAAGVQAARAGLAYGAMAEGWFAVAIAHRAGRLEGDLAILLLSMSVVSLGLFVFGVAMNDVLDRKQDRAFANERPGRGLLSVQWLAALAVVSLLAALAAASQFGRSGMLVAGLAAGGIVAYNVLAKFIPAFGFVSLGAIGALHMLVPDQHPGVLLPFWFSMTFTAIVAGFVHRLRQKRPAATVRGMLVATALWAAWSAVLAWWIAPQTLDPMVGFEHPREGILGILSFLEQKGLARTYAEPTLTAMSGQTASFLAGGEFPVPVTFVDTVSTGSRWLRRTIGCAARWMTTSAAAAATSASSRVASRTSASTCRSRSAAIPAASNRDGSVAGGSE